MKQGQHEAHGALFGVEGEIAIGSSVETTTSFKGEIEGWQLVAPQPTGDDGTDCSPIRDVQPDDPLVWRLHGPVRTKMCKLTSPDGKSLLLLVYRRAPFERIRWVEASLCRALLLAVRSSEPRMDFLGCLAAEWGRVTEADASLNLFQSLEGGRLALIR